MSTNPRNAKLALPDSPGLRLSCLHLGTGNQIALAGAAVGLCWRGPGRPQVKLTAGDLASYGIRVYDDIIQRDGVSAKDFWDCAQKAVTLLSDADDPGDEEVQEHLGNSVTAPSGP